jgi:flagellar biosynthesis/type III secretory pathway chaperone
MTTEQTSPIVQLEHLLQDEAAGYRQLVVLTRQEQDALKANDIDLLATIVRGKAMVMATLRCWESAREKMLQERLVGDFNLPPTATLSDLI